MKDPLLSLAPTELNALAASIRSGRVDAAFLPQSVGRFVGSVDGDLVSRRLVDLHLGGMSPLAICACLELLAQSAAARRPLEDAVDLVTTGPEAGGVANRNTAVVVSDLFRNAQHSVLVAGYAIYQGQKVFQALATRMEQHPDLQVRMFLDVPRSHGDTSPVEEQIAGFVHAFKTTQWPEKAPTPNVYCSEQLIDPQRGKPGSLHAKCIVVDDEQVFVSSANFTEAGQERNIEVGVLIRSSIVAERLIRFFGALVENQFFRRTI